MWAVDDELGFAGLKSYVFQPAVIEADKLGQLRTGAASGVAAKYLAKPNARTLGVIGCGWQAESQVACIREALPGIEEVVAYCRTEEKLAAFCRKLDAQPGRVRHGHPARGNRRRGAKGRTGACSGTSWTTGPCPLPRDWTIMAPLWHRASI